MLFMFAVDLDIFSWFFVCNLYSHFTPPRQQDILPLISDFFIFSWLGGYTDTSNNVINKYNLIIFLITRAYLNMRNKYNLIIWSLTPAYLTMRNKYLQSNFFSMTPAYFIMRNECNLIIFFMTQPIWLPMRNKYLQSINFSMTQHILQREISTHQSFGSGSRRIRDFYTSRIRDFFPDPAPTKGNPS